MKAIVNKDACIGCGACSAICPNVFDFDDAEGHAVVKAEKIEDADKAAATEAKEGCPTSAISVEGE